MSSCWVQPVCVEEMMNKNVYIDGNLISTHLIDGAQFFFLLSLEKTKRFTSCDKQPTHRSCTNHKYKYKHLLTKQEIKAN